MAEPDAETLTWLAARVDAFTAERLRRVGPDRPRTGTRVVYWMRSAVRGHENPALDAAIAAADALDLPLLVYHAVSERYRYASDRHHAFLLEGARAVAPELAARGVPYALHVERPGHRGPVLAELAGTAALLVTEDVPVEPMRRWTQSVARVARGPVIAVDAACVAPMSLSARPPARAFEFRAVMAPHWRLRRGHLFADARPRRRDAADAGGPLPFAPVDPRLDDLPALVASCAIDHGVAPVPDTRGGAPAGYARWAAFVRGGLRRYHERRNDPLAEGGVSRMSAYLHHGHVSPFRLARDAASVTGPGAEKFLDELLLWREIAWHWCSHMPDPGALAALPAWASATLAEHAGDARDPLPLEALARGETGDALWDAAQRSLLIHGELHNNVRMTWGKAFLGWSRDAEAALARAIDLNHRYALDGRDPASYGGLLWCLGLFDRPFTPAGPVYGALRPRPTAHHAARLDVPAYAARMARPAIPAPPRVAVIGAGLAGAACARTLADHGLAVTVFDKGRAPGGRTSSRRVGELRFDHGAPKLDLASPRLAERITRWEGAGVLARAGRAWLGTPSATALTTHLARGLAVECGAQVTALTRDGAGWRLALAAGGERGPFDLVVVTAPAPQAQALFATAGDPAAFGPALAEVAYAPCLAAMITWAAPVTTPDLGATGPLAGAWAMAARPGRPTDARAWVAHATADVSVAQLEDDPAVSARALAEAVAAALPGAAIADVIGHRWRYARVTRPLAAPYLLAREVGLGYASDACAFDAPAPSAARAVLAGIGIAGRILHAAGEVT